MKPTRVIGRNYPCRLWFSIWNIIFPQGSVNSFLSPPVTHYHDPAANACNLKHVGR